MKEERFFYHPDAAASSELPPKEAEHALRVLRMAEGDPLMLIDGRGTFYEAHITATSKRSCHYAIDAALPQQKGWHGHLHVALAPTKMNERTEWFVEKATEVGIDAISFLDCRFSERRAITRERFERVALSAVKQSRKAWLPQLSDLTAFKTFVTQPFAGRKFIAHCYNEPDLCAGGKRYLLDALSDTASMDGAVVLIGPEGDFSTDEVRLALANGYQPVSLGESRLRTETAALVAAHLLQIAASRGR